MSGKPRLQAQPSKLLVYGPIVDSLFNGVLGDRVTPQLRERLRQAGLNLSRPVLPAYQLHQFEAFLEVTAHELYSDVPFDDALFSLGEAQVDAFARTLVGRAAFSFMRMVGVRRSLEQITCSWRNANNFVRTRVHEPSPGTLEVWVNEVGRQPQVIHGTLSRTLHLISSQSYQVTMQHYDGHSCTYLLEQGP
jgi:uncharacterized protein (TIGR02265 family)